MRKFRTLILSLFIAMLTINACAGSAMAEQQTVAIRDMMQAYEDVLAGKRSYIQCNQGEAVDREVFMPNEIDHWYGWIFESPLKFDTFCVADLDADGYPEIILELSDYFGFELLRYENGVVYGFPFVFRAMLDATLEGDIYGSSGAADNGWYKIRFFADRYEETETCRMQSNGDDIQYFIGDTEVSSRDYRNYEDQIMQKKRPLWMEYTPDHIKVVVSSF